MAIGFLRKVLKEQHLFFHCRRKECFKISCVRVYGSNDGTKSTS